MQLHHFPSPGILSSFSALSGRFFFLPINISTRRMLVPDYINCINRKRKCLFHQLQFFREESRWEWFLEMALQMQRNHTCIKKERKFGKISIYLLFQREKKKSMTFHSSILNTNSHNALSFTSTFTLLDMKMLTYLDHVCSVWQDGDPTFLLSWTGVKWTLRILLWGWNSARRTYSWQFDHLSWRCVMNIWLSRG